MRRRGWDRSGSGGSGGWVGCSGMSGGMGGRSGWGDNMSKCNGGDSVVRKETVVVRVSTEYLAKTVATFR